MAVYLGKKKIGINNVVDLPDNLDKELTEQETLLTDLETQVNELSDKPQDMLQARVDGCKSCRYLFYSYLNENMDFIKNLNTTEATDMHQMFYSCSNLKSLDVSKLDTSKVTTMHDMFYRCRLLKELDLSNFNTEKVTDIYQMFYYCEGLTNLDLSSFNTSRVTDMAGLFHSCYNLESVNLSNFNTTKTTNMIYMFNNCRALTSLDLSSFDTSSVTQMNSMFNSCYALETIQGNINMIKATSVSSMFYDCRALTNVTLKNIKKSLQIGSGTSYGTLLSDESLINTIQELWDLTGSTSQKLTLSTTSKENIANIYVKFIDVTDEMLAQDQYAGNKKPCVVCEPTDEGAMTLTEYATSKNWAIA